MGRKRSEGMPPYVSYRTFSNFLTELKARGLPSRIDRSMLPHKSGTVQSRLLLTLAYLGLVRESGHPTDRLKKLMEAEASRRRVVLRDAIESSYGFVFSGGFDLESATSRQTEDLFARTGASGETLRRAIAFFLAAARDAGIPVSPYIKPHRRSRTSPARKAAGDDVGSSPSPPRRGGEGRRVPLRSGGSLRLELDGSVFDLDRQDREFVFGLIDRLQEYEKQS